MINLVKDPIKPLQRNPYFAVTSVILSMGLIQCGFGLLNVLAPALLADAGYAPNLIGLHGAIASLGFLLGTIFAPALIRNIGHIRAFAVFASLDTIGALMMTIQVDIWIWAIIRSFMGFALSGIFTVCESWITTETPVKLRGRVLGFYIIMYKIASVAAPFSLSLAPSPQNTEDIIRYFLLISGFFSLAVLPIALTRTGIPKQTPTSSPPLSIKAVYIIAPASVIATILNAMSNTAVTSMIPVYANMVGYGIAGGALFFAATQLGNLICQWPIGRLSDTMDRRYVLISLSSIVLITSLILAKFGVYFTQLGLLILLACWGAAALSIYAVSVAHAADQAQPDQMVSVCSTILLAFSIGMVLGPLWAGFLMDLFGPDSLFYNSAGFSLCIIAFLLWRIYIRPNHTGTKRKPFMDISATSLKFSAIYRYKNSHGNTKP